MCGRYAYGVETEKIVKRFDITEILMDTEPDEDVHPTQVIPVITLGPNGRRLEPMRWGISVRPGGGGSLARTMINARAETLAQRPTFRHSYRMRRCLIPADGFYEWAALRARGARKVVTKFELGAGELFAFAGIWDSAPPGEGPRRSAAIITCAPNSLVAAVHDRMPVILSPEAEPQWLGAPYDPRRLGALLAPLPADRMRAYAPDSHAGPPPTPTQPTLALFA